MKRRRFYLTFICRRVKTMDVEFYGDHNLDTRDFYAPFKDYDMSMSNKRVPKQKITFILKLAVSTVANISTFNLDFSLVQKALPIEKILPTAVLV
ncbi:hypothetical protein TNCV_873721 [Trichonephila clavipes]|nr:hypothetical protein TNCV_873721 [Trichonephila clavipes]